MSELPDHLAAVAGAEAAAHDYPLLFATVSGAHLYGFASADSDIDVRGCHLLPIADVVGLWNGRETIESSHVRDGVEVDLVTHDAAKFFSMLLKRNGYVLEQVLSPLRVRTGPPHEELCDIARGCVTRHHAYHYLGFARSTRKLFAKTRQRKPLLYTYRVLLTGLHLMRSGEVETNLERLNEDAGLSTIRDLIEAKRSGEEHGTLGDADGTAFEAELDRLTAELEAAKESSSLPERAAAADRLHDFLVRLRLS